MNWPSDSTQKRDEKFTTYAYISEACISWLSFQRALDEDEEENEENIIMLPAFLPPSDAVKC